MLSIAARGADEAWREAITALTQQIGGPSQPSRNGNVFELMHLVLSIQDPTQRWVSSRVPALNPAFALVESFWIAAGRDDLALPSFWNRALPDFVGHQSNLGGAYGFRLAKHFGVDQLLRAYRILDSNPDSRQVVLQVWDPGADLPSSDGNASRADIPCNVMAMLKIRSGCLEWSQILRSNDAFRGFPYNVVQFTILQEMLAGWLGADLGEYTHFADSFHVYEADVDAICRTRTVESPFWNDSFRLPRPVWEVTMRAVMGCLDALASSNLAESDVPRMRASIEELPLGYSNALRIVAAEAMRRRNWLSACERFTYDCTSAGLLFVWNQWLTRMLNRPSSSVRNDTTKNLLRS